MLDQPAHEEEALLAHRQLPERSSIIAKLEADQALRLSWRKSVGAQGVGFLLTGKSSSTTADRAVSITARDSSADV